jgi:hypothetical protein
MPALKVQSLLPVIVTTFSVLRPASEHPGIVILIRRRTRPAEIAGLQTLISGAGEQGLANNVNFA